MHLKLYNDIQKKWYFNNVPFVVVSFVTKCSLNVFLEYLIRWYVFVSFYRYGVDLVPNKLPFTTFRTSARGVSEVAFFISIDKQAAIFPMQTMLP